ncbi:MAG: 16S rRNA (guanine(527)-N(7))-methyltransferase RsmG [Gammaproteobacteria bacterium]
MDRQRLLGDIEGGLESLGLEHSAGFADALADYVGLLDHWNRAYNLTAVRQPKDMVARHLLDSLAVLPFIGAGPVLDVGTGAGLPGLVLALAHREQPFVLLDASGKKTRFVEHAARQLGLDNVSVVRERVEDYRPGEEFPTVISRAFASLEAFASAAGHLVGPGGRLLAMKGELPESELADLPAGWRLCGVHRLQVPGLDARRHLLEFIRGEAAP